jgi:hypothetical protein
VGEIDGQLYTIVQCDLTGVATQILTNNKVDFGLKALEFHES